MKIIKVEVARTFNIGNYQSLKLGLEAEVEIGEDQIEATKTLNTKLLVLRDILGPDYIEATNIVNDTKRNYSKTEKKDAQSLIDQMHKAFT
jgi:hypothetical protein